jgi:hypothetical protein
MKAGFTERESVVAAALIYQSLVPCPEFAKLALEDDKIASVSTDLNKWFAVDHGQRGR